MHIENKILPKYCYKNRVMNSVDAIVIHYFSGLYVDPQNMFDNDVCYDMFKDLNLPGPERKHVMEANNDPRFYASAHYMIGREGEVFNLVPLPYIAWHAGKSELNGRKYCNNYAVGIEMIATYDSGYTDEQYSSLAVLCSQMMIRYDISMDMIVGHEDVAPGRKKDPGPKFDWDRYRLLGEF